MSEIRQKMAVKLKHKGTSNKINGKKFQIFARNKNWNKQERGKKCGKLEKFAVGIFILKKFWKIKNK